MWTILKKDRILQLFFAVLTVIWLPYFLPAFSDFRGKAHYYGEPINLSLLMLALQHGIRKIEKTQERRFWNYLTLVFATWLLVRCLEVLGPLGPKSWYLPGFGVAADLIYMFYYLFFFMAT